MKKGEKIDMGNGFVFHIVSENESKKSLIGYLKHKTECQPIGQMSLLKGFVEKLNKI